MAPAGVTLRPVTDLRAELLANFRWRSDPTRWPEERASYADYTIWWRTPSILQALGPALADLFTGSEPTAVMGTESPGCLLGPLVANHLSIGFAQIRKGARRLSDDDPWLTQRTPPTATTGTLSWLSDDRRCARGTEFCSSMTGSPPEVKPSPVSSLWETPEPTGLGPRSSSAGWRVRRRAGISTCALCCTFATLTG